MAGEQVQVTKKKIMNTYEKMQAAPALAAAHAAGITIRGFLRLIPLRGGVEIEAEHATEDGSRVERVMILTPFGTSGVTVSRSTGKESRVDKFSVMLSDTGEIRFERPENKPAVPPPDNPTWR